MPNLQVDAILFDMDGTLIDDSHSYREATRRTAEYVLQAPVHSDEVEALKQIPGFNNDWDAVWALVHRRTGRPVQKPTDADRATPLYQQLQDIFQTYYLGDVAWQRLSGRGSPFAWADPLIQRETLLVREDTLARLGVFQLGIATSRPRAEALLAFEQHGLDRFFSTALLVGLEDADYEKPHPAPLYQLARLMDCTRPVYVGDTINDALAAREAGMPFILVGSDHLSDPEVDRHIEYRLPSVNELETICLPLAGRNVHA